jgi:hypothetical protein
LSVPSEIVAIVELIGLHIGVVADPAGACG